VPGQWGILRSVTEWCRVFHGRHCLAALGAGLIPHCPRLPGKQPSVLALSLVPINFVPILAVLPLLAVWYWLDRRRWRWSFGDLLAAMFILHFSFALVAALTRRCRPSSMEGQEFPGLIVQVSG
jgi:hypothetical protein